MAKKPPHSGDPKSGFGVKINLEPDAEELFRQAIEEDFHPDKAESTAERSAAPQAHNAGSKMPRQLDLHGLNLEEAKRAVDRLIATFKAQMTTPVRVTIITGKGLHSGQGGGVLVHEIYRYVRQRYDYLIGDIESAPLESALGGVPMRGHFEVELRKGK